LLLVLPLAFLLGFVLRSPAVGAQPGTQEAATGHRREIVDRAEKAEAFHSFEHSQPERRAADASSRKGDSYEGVGCGLLAPFVDDPELLDRDGFGVEAEPEQCQGAEVDDAISGDFPFPLERDDVLFGCVAEIALAGDVVALLPELFLKVPLRSLR